MMQIDVHNLSFAYGHRAVLRNMSFSLAPGDYLVVTGKNGTGKTTLIKCLLGFNPVKSGMIFYNHQDIINFKDWTSFGYVSQKYEDFNYEYPITVDELLAVNSLKKIKQPQRLKILDQLGILEIINENINKLSGGQLQRVFIARAMLNNPLVLILDEPTASIDKLNTKFFFQTVNELNSQGITIIMITHNESFDNMNYSHILNIGIDMNYHFQVREKCDLTEVEV
ncbi:MAG: ATP-binding cassette domain-containing protein [Candidatus Izemoplasmatales bacterium]|jgi:zinc transport system ATP-binding protein|nr:ATP-binding cassette domain-containing protein [Candidatus Izemoplasmatales bacterium]MDD4987862.1 ATP-binding cassette domain-containing protein [Candidatus Izemoplasmatales bacterium]MDD5601777.1 ATP-binding cassette domain-containing protein [Candidatus Izemoplasmatales bacterium]MDY0373438.1 ATP-binding cassette domain-containing protein [Candidatus Izemoplasmatales bacterium]NLF48983.1 ATP-binding cassette domain-containing protein [Acholeplasmataceae bacterium]